MRFRLIESLLVEDIQAVKDKYPDIDNGTFHKLIALDPTFDKSRNSVGTYGKWILNGYKTGKITEVDFGHLTDILTRFESEKKYLKNKDINSFKSVHELDSYMNDNNNYNEQSHRQEVRQRQKDRRNADITDDLVFSGNVFDVYVPSSYANSCKLGQNTSWCTASTENDYYYNYYKGVYGGNYYILINKEDNNEKYQLHFESNQFMDSDDTEIDVFDAIFNVDQKVLKYFYDNVPSIKNLIDIGKKYNNIPTSLLQFYLRDKEQIKREGISEEEFFKYVCRGYLEDTLYIFRDGIGYDVFYHCIPELDMGDYIEDYLYAIKAVKVLDGVTSLDYEQLEYLPSIENIDFGNTLQVITGPIAEKLDVFAGRIHIKLPKSLQRIQDCSFPLSSINNIAIPSGIVDDSLDLSDIIDFNDYVRYSVVNIFIDNPDEVRKVNEPNIPEDVEVNFYSYDEYDKFVK